MNEEDKARLSPLIHYQYAGAAFIHDARCDREGELRPLRNPADNPD
jgi:hypothetical protein